MLVFVNEQGQTLVTRSSLRLMSSFSLPELDRQLNAIVESMIVTPRPIFQVQGSLGNKNYLNLFGEDPMQIQLRGIVVGGNCAELRAVDSSVGVAVNFYEKHGVINNPTSLKYTIRGRAAQEAFLVGLTVAQESAFADFARFEMLLLAESLQKKSLAAAKPPARLAAFPAAGQWQPGRALRQSPALASEVTQLLTSGDVSTVQSRDVIATGFDLSQNGFQ